MTGVCGAFGNVPPVVYIHGKKRPELLASHRDIPMHRRALIGWLLAGVMASSLWNNVRAENWPCWRGPRGDGTSLEKGLPRQWDGESGRNIIWKTPVPGVGHASPIVWEDRIFLVSCLEDRQDRILLCYDRQTGKQLWQRTVLRAPLEDKHTLNSYASSTPATDGELVYVTFLEVGEKTVEARNVSKPRPVRPGKMVVAAYDFNGNRKWLVRPGEFVSVHGYCSCPVLYKDKVIINGDHDGDSYIVALDKETGETIWKTRRRFKTRSYCTPIIRRAAGRTQMVLAGSHCLASFDPDTGELIWWVQGPTEQFVASMVYDGRLFYMTAGFPSYHVMAIRPDGEGDVTETHVVWHVTDARCYVPSPVVLNGYLFVSDDQGIANCYEAATGKRLWRARFGRHYSTSLVTAEGLVYFLADDGEMKIVSPGPEPDIVAINQLGEFCYASPAISRSTLYIRGEKHLFAIGSHGQ